MKTMYDFLGSVRKYRAGGMSDDFVARQVVDDLWRLGVDVRFQQHVVEEVLRAFDREGPRA